MTRAVGSPVHPKPRETLDRCALRAQLRGDPMLGTAFPAARLLLVEQPGPWGHGGLRESRFPTHVALALEERGRREGVRIEAVRRPGRTPRSAPRRWAYADTRDGRTGLTWGTYERAEELLDLSFDEPGGIPDPNPAYLVCAHSKHDACCALRGRPVAAALEALRPGAVWEASHLGGDRFAANVLVLPAGLMYGRILPFAAAEFIDAAEAGEVVGALLRGRIGVKPAAQAALGYAHDQLALRRRADLQVETVGPVVDEVVVVRLHGPHGRFDVALRVQRVAADGLTCRSPGPSSYVAFRPLSIEQVDEPAR